MPRPFLIDLPAAKQRSDILKKVRDLLQRTATHCNTLQHVATHGNARQHTAAHGSTRQHTAT